GIDAIRDAGFQAGVDGFLDKPVIRSRLVRGLVKESCGHDLPQDRRTSKILRHEDETGEQIGGARILLVEDTEINQVIARELLERAGLVVDLAANGRQAVEMVQRFPFDAVLMDLQMPEMDGLEATRLLRAQEAFRDLPIIAMTAHTSSTEKKACESAGMTAHLSKPIRPERLYGVLSRWIGPLTVAEQPGRSDLDREGLMKIPGLDVEAGLARVRGNRGLYGRLLDRFLQEYQESIDTVQHHLAHQENSEAAALVHGIRGVAGNLGAVALQEAAARLERLLDGADTEPAAIQAATSRFVNVLDDLLSGLDDSRKPLQPGALLPESSDLDPAALADPARLGPLLAVVARHLERFDLAFEEVLPGLEALLEPTAARNLYRALLLHGREYAFREMLQTLEQLAELHGIVLEDVAVAEQERRDQETILIVDDQPSNIDILKELLKADYALQAVTSGQQALSLTAGEAQPDLILLDIMMPGMNGYEVCSRLKQRSETAPVPVIFITAKKEVEDETEGFRLGGVDYITKPFNPEIVSRRIKTHLALKRHRDHLEEIVRQRTHELEEARDAAESGSRAKSSFLATMSHEIRTPLNAILGMAQALDETDLSDEQHAFVTIFHRAGEELLALINDVLDLSRVESGKMELSNEVFSLHDLVETTVRMIRPRAEEKGLSVALEIDAKMSAHLFGDARRLRQVLLNLMDNAVKFTHDGSVTLAVTPDAERESRVLFVIRDTGIGIAPEKLEEIFQGFVQADATITRSYGGSGLGLAICRRLVALMHGEIRVESVLDAGTSFHLSLPLPARMEVQGSESVSGHAEEGAVVPGASILLVEDSEDNVLLVEIFLKKTPHTLVVARDGEEALKLFRKQRFDLVLMDVQMPKMDGYEATRRIRKREKKRGQPKTPVVILTAHAFESERQKAVDAGCDGYLTKPLSKRLLIDTIGDVLLSE
ncbi:MAG: response regulator, partial [Magnetococcales bacterium]|nr:response regulator [Magnetococcales bacterium]